MFSDRGLIWVENSLYGRTDSSICSTAHPPLQVTDTSCSTSISTIAERYSVSWVIIYTKALPQLEEI